MIGVSTSQPVGFHPMDAEPNSRPSEISNSESELPVTLLIKHLPDAIPHSTLSRLFSHYGAFSLRPCSAGRMRNCAFVDFKNEAVAYQAQRQLNGLRFLGKILIVERAFNSTKNEKLDKAESQLEKESLSRTLVTDNSLGKDGSEGLKPRPLSVGEPIAPRLGVDYPFPPHLEYVYPPPDGNILTNIVNALISVPRFYTQVLHLMNKMNIPAPFRMALPTPPLPHILPSSAQPLSAPSPPIDVKTNLSDLSSGESEMASSDEEADGKTILSGVPKVAKSGRKRVRRDAIVGPAVDKEVAHEAVGLKSASLIPKEMPIIKRKNPVLQIKIVPKVTQDELKDDDIKKEPGDSGSKDLGLQPYATSEELKVGKLPPEEILSLPMFKNYAAGNPTPVLYIKNLAKDVVSDDFYYIFGSLFGSIESTKSSLAVKLMQEGRMRGQAFVTFPTVELAHHALDVVNGFMFKGKPMIIQFGRNPAAGKPS